MSDFDQFFKEKLDEEGHFPRQGKSWRALSKRLDAFDAGIQQHPGSTVTRVALRYWQAAAAAAVLVAGVLTWEVASVRRENAQLRREIAALKEQKTQTGQQAPQVAEKAGSVPLLPGVWEMTNSPALENDIVVKKAAPQDRAAANPPAFEIIDLNNSKPTEYNEKAPPPLQTPAAPDKTDIAQTLNPAAGAEQKAARADTAAVQATKPGNTDNSDTGTAGITNPVNLQNPLLSDSLNRAVAAVPKDSTQRIPPLRSDTTTTRPVAAAPLIEPVRPPSRFRVGVEALAGQVRPSSPGVSLVTGQGLSAEFNVWRRLWLIASADWLRFDVSADKFYPKVHPGHEPPPMHGGPGPHNDDLEKVESSQRRQYLSLGLRYELPLRFWIRPTVSIAHTWGRISPELISYKYDDHGPGGPPHQPKYIVRKSDAQIVGNIWRFSAGLEHVRPRWTFGLWADYSNNLGPGNATFDMAALRAGVQYRL